MKKDKRLPDDLDPVVADVMQGGSASKVTPKPKPPAPKISEDEDESDQNFFTRKKLSLEERRAKAREGLVDAAMKK
jgi:hypothetical protein